MLLDRGRVSISTDEVHFLPSLAYGVNEHFLKVFVLSYAKFLYDSPLEITSPRPWRQVGRFLKRLTTSHLRDVIREFSSLADTILSTSYSPTIDSSIRVWLPQMKNTPIFMEYHHWFRTGDPLVLQYVLSFLRFGKKIKYVDEELDATAFRGWLKVEEKLDTLKFVDEDTAALRTIVSALVGPLGIDDVYPSFGGGKVSEAHILDVYDKLEKLASHPRLEYAFRTSKVAYHRGFGYTNGFGDLYGPVHKGWISSDVSRLKFVPKDITKSRSICMEPNSFMYYQQAVRRWVNRSLDSSPISAFVNLRDQSANRQAALHGSKYLCSDTIDLSSASDSVHMELVNRIFPPDWLFYLHATRTSRVKIPDGTERSVNKFAPMGSALCFPTQCIIFTAVCVYAYLAHSKGKTTGIWVPTRDEVDVVLRRRNSLFRERSAHSPFGQAYETPVVYGDDIICDSRVTDIIVSILSRLGFEVNVDKSFTGPMSFRESCGVYAYRGEDVTPVQFRIPFLVKGGRWDAKMYVSMMENVNLMRAKGYNHLASFWLSMLRGYGFKYPLPFTTDINAFGMYTANKHNVHGKFFKAWTVKPSNEKEPWYQVDQELVQGVGLRKPKRKRPENLDSYSLDQYWRSRMGEVTTPRIMRSSSIRPQETRLVPIWARCE